MTGFGERGLRQLRGHTPTSMRRAYRRLPVSWRQSLATRYEAPWQARDRKDRDHLRLLLQLAVYENDSCIDVGANHGAVLADIVRAAPQGRHIAIEPIDALAAGLRVRFPDVDVRSVALADYRGRAAFEIVDGTEALSSLVVGRDLGGFGSPPRHQVEVEVWPLDEIVAPDRTFRLIKIDVESAELAVLRGAQRTIDRSRPILVVEHVGTDLQVTSEFWKLVVDGLGYRLFDVDGEGPLGHDELLELAAPQDRWSWVAHP